MICDVLIIKDGMPLFVKSIANSINAFTQGDNLIMVSGFFSALNSFSDSFDDLGTISELKLSNNELKLSFLKDSSIPNLIYLATYDDKSKGVNVQRTLRKIARSFLMKYNINQIINWNGKIDAFRSFEKWPATHMPMVKRAEEIGEVNVEKNMATPVITASSKNVRAIAFRR